MTDENLLVEKIITKLDEIINPVVSTVKENNYKIEAFPENPTVYELNHPNGAVLVRMGSYRPSLLTGNKQSDFSDVILTLLANGLKGTIGVYSLTELTRKAMEEVFHLGARFYITGATPPDIFQDDVWTRDLTFTLPGVHLVGL